MPVIEEPVPGNLAAPPAESLPGIQTLMDKGPLQIFWTHGMCSHDETWARDRATLLSYSLGSGAPVISQKISLDGTGLHEADPYTVKATVRSSTGTAEVSFFVWSPMTKGYKADVKIDNDKTDPPGRNDYRRAKLNGALKKGLINDCLVDAVVYSGKNGDPIRRAMQAALCGALGGRLASNDQCDIADSVNDAPLVFVTESLGSKFLFDAVRDLWQEQTEANREKVARRLRSIRMLYMAANQIPLLDPANPLLPTGGLASVEESRPAQSSLGVAVDIIRASKSAGARLLNLGPEARPLTPIEAVERELRPWTIVAFTDPNDLLSYRLWPTIVGRDENRERTATDPRLINVIVSNDDTLLGYVERPDNAHCGYRWNPNVIGLMLYGYDLNRPQRRAANAFEKRGCF